MRPGRLDRILYVGPPDREAREEILKIRMRSMAVGPKVDVRAIAELVSLAPGYFLMNNSLSLLRLKDVLGRRSQRSARKLLSSQCKMTWTRHTQVLSIPSKTLFSPIVFYLGPTWKVHRSCEVYKTANHPCGAAKIYQVAKWKRRSDAVRQYVYSVEEGLPFT